MSRATRPELVSSLDLTPVLSQRCALGFRHLLLAVAAGTVFLFQSHAPLSDPGLWSDVAYGRWILEHHTVPHAEPFLRLAEGMTFVDSSWLGQVALAAIEQAGGAAALADLFAVLATATYFILGWAFYRKTQNVALACAGALVVWLLHASDHSLAGSAQFGQLCLALLLLLQSSTDSKTETVQRKPWILYLQVAFLFAVWANLDSSFIAGLAILGCTAIAKSIEAVWQSRSLTGAFSDSSSRRAWLVFELAIVATLLNPYGDKLLAYELFAASSGNALSLAGWQSIDLTSRVGIPVALSWMLMMFVFRRSRVAIRPVEVLLLATFSAAGVLQARFVAFYLPVAIYVLAPHLSDLLEQFRRTRPAVRIRAAVRPLQVQSFRYTLLAALTVWLAFALSPTSRFMLGGKERSAEQLYGGKTPLALTQYLVEHPPEGQIANPEGWGDWLVHKGPRELQIFMTTQGILTSPARVWSDHLSITRGETGFEDLLSRYRVNTIVVDKPLQQKLTVALRRSTNWRIAYEDAQGLVAMRAGSND